LWSKVVSEFPVFHAHFNCSFIVIILMSYLLFKSRFWIWAFSQYVQYVSFSVSVFCLIRWSTVLSFFSENRHNFILYVWIILLCVCIYICHIFLIHFCIDGYLDWFHYLAIVNSPKINKSAMKNSLTCLYCMLTLIHFGNQKIRWSLHC
jgi:hypothetical protein